MPMPTERPINYETFRLLYSTFSEKKKKKKKHAVRFEAV